MMKYNWLGSILVLLQLVGIGLTCLAALISPTTQAVYLIITLIGAIIGLVTLRHNQSGNFGIHPKPREQAQLVTTGPYRFVRHPMYFSVVVSLLGLSLYSSNPLGWMGLAIATIAVFLKAFIEEKYLSARFPEYKAYQSQTKRIIPFIF